MRRRRLPVTSGAARRRLLWAVYLLACAGCGRAPITDVGPKLHVEQSTQRAQTLLMSELEKGPTTGKDVVARFSFANRSKAAAKLKFAGTSCYCVGLHRLGNKLKTGETFRLAGGSHESLEMVAHVVPLAEVHQFLATLTVEGQPGQPPIELRFHVPVLPDVKFTPDSLLQEFAAQDIRPVERTLEIERTARSQAAPQEVCKDLKLPPQVQLLTLEPAAVPQELEPGLWRLAWRATVRVEPDEHLQGASEPATATATFTDGSRTTRVATLSVILRRRSGIDAPRDVHLGIVPVGEVRTRKLLISAADRRAFKVASVRSTSGELSARVTALDGTRHWVEVTYRAQTPGKLKSELDLATDHPDCPHLIIRVIGTCQTNSGKLAHASGD